MRALTCLTALPAMALAALTLAACDQPAPPPIATEPLPPSATEPSPLDPISCKSADLALKRLGEDAGAGQRHVVYALTNNGRAACTLRGFVTASWFDADGKPLDGVNVIDAEGGDAGQVTVAPAGRAVFTISYTGIQATDKLCVTSATMYATPPGDTRSLQMQDVISPCTDHVSLGPIRAETPDDAQTAN